MDPFPALFASCPPVETAMIGPFCLRRSGGGGRRSQAVTLEGDPAEAEAALGPAFARLAEWDERPVFMVRPGEAALDALLDARGLVAEGTSVIYAGPAAEVALRRNDLTVIDCDGPIAVIQEIWDLAPARLGVMERVVGPKRYLLGRLDDRPAAAAFVSIGGGMGMLNALAVLPGARRRGLGRRMVQWAAAWTADHGAPTLALAVEAENVPARALYEGLGMTEVARYHYRAAPR